MTGKTRICFVCLGNIVRSPLAENLFRHYVEKEGLAHKYEIDSAGTSGWHVGEAPDSRMCRVAGRRGVNVVGCARQFRPADFDRFDMVVVMDNSNREEVLRWAPDEAARAKVRLLREYDPQANRDAPVPDPYYGGIHGFEEVYQIVDRSVRGLFKNLEGDGPGDQR